MERPNQTWFSERLRQFLEERHPSQPRYRRMIERRSRLAFEGYSQSLEAGVPVDQAIRVADRILFRGLLFGTLRRESRALAYVVTVLVYALSCVWRYAWQKTTGFATPADISSCTSARCSPRRFLWLDMLTTTTSG